MIIKMPVLVKDHNWNIHRDKLREEAGELIDVINQLEYAEEVGCKNIEEIKRHMTEETFDLMQICIGILDKLEADLNEGQREHVKKLIGRGWAFKKILTIKD